MQRLSIAGSCVPSQEHTRQGLVNPRQFGPNDWKFDVMRATQVDWQPGNDTLNDNYFAKGEGYQTIKNGMFARLTGEEPMYGHVNYKLNPLEQEQTNAHMSAYQNQKMTRVSDNMSPAGSMRFPWYQYPANTPPNIWVHRFNGSARQR